MVYSFFYCFVTNYHSVGAWINTLLLTHSFQESGVWAWLSWSLSSGLTGCSQDIDQAVFSFQAHSGGWRTSVSCSYVTEDPNSFPVCSQELLLGCTCSSLPCASIGTLQHSLCILQGSRSSLSDFFSVIC